MKRCSSGSLQLTPVSHVHTGQDKRELYCQLALALLLALGLAAPVTELCCLCLDYFCFHPALKLAS